MPISPEKAGLYPPDWFEVSQDVKLRAGYCCEGSPAYPDCRAADRAPHPVTGSRVVLTTAHLDHNPANNDRRNLRALCQRCHVTYDAELHALSAMTRKQRALRAAGQTVLPIPGGPLFREL